MGAAKNLPASVQGSKGGSKKPKSPTIASNSTPSLSTVKIVYLWSWGPIEGPVGGLRAIKLDGTPIVAENGTVNYPGVKWQFRNGELNQDRLEGLAESSNEIAVGQTLLSTAPYLYSVNTPIVDAVRVRLSWPQLQAQDSNGNVGGVRIDYAIDVATDGGPFVTALQDSVNRKNVTTYYRSHRIDLPAGSRWTVRVRRITPEANSSTVQDGMVVTAIAEVIDSDLEYPLTAVGLLEYDAQLFDGNFAKVAARMRGRIVRVPANYDPETRTYATVGAGTTNGVWDGTFKEAYTNNPAWVYYDLVLNPYFGLGDRIDATMVDKWALYRVAQYCDQPVDDGAGGKEPRFTCNVYLQKQADAYAVLQDVASIFRGMSYWDGSQVVVTADMPSDPVFSYSPSQILNDGAVKYAGTRARDRHSLAIVSWDNPALGFETDKEPVFDEDAIGELGVRELNVAAFGCTSLGQAQRAGNWALLSEQLQTRSAVLQVGLDGGVPKPGQIIALADPMLAGRANGGRISAVNGRAITLDRDVEVPAGARLFLNLPSGRSEARAVRSVAGRVVTVVADFSETPVPELGWALDFDDLAVMQFYVKNVSRPEWHMYELEVMQHQPAKYAAIDSGAVIDDRPISVLPPGVQEAPARVLLSQHVVIEQGIAVTVMTIGWDMAPGAVAYDVEWRWGSNEWVKLPRTGELTADVRGIYSGQYLARVRAVSAMDVASLPTTSQLTNLEGKTGAPPVLASLTTSPLVFGIRIDWSFPRGVEDTQRTEFEYANNATGQNAMKLGDFAYPANTHTMTGLAAGVTFWFRARLVDRTGNIGPWSGWVMGQSSADASVILEYITGQITETQLGQNLLDRIDLIDGDGPGSVNERIQDAVSQAVDALAYDPNQAYAQGEAVRGGPNGRRLYQALVDVPAASDGSNAPPNDNLWMDVGQVVETANGLAVQVAENTAGISVLDGIVTATASSLAVLQAAYRDDDGEGELADALKGWDSAARITQVARTVATENMAMAEQINQLDAAVGDTSAVVQQTSQALVDLEGKASALTTIKTQTTVDGRTVMAGLAIGVEGEEQEAQILAFAQRFAILDESSGELITPFVVQGGQIFANSAVFNQADIVNLIVTGELRSSDYVEGQQGIRINFVTNEFEVNGSVPGEGRITINNKVITAYHPNGVKGLEFGIGG
ncbi:host specificity protein J [Stutzerimonas nitrititolerans]|uniref:host specificity protein J n=1 Tax=Stutzerimonas nitrititolerans TaxID=2482751 RepID=UPI0028A1940A|nr:phage tail protein [Stutzerimonas nitrititolerans]